MEKPDVVKEKTKTAINNINNFSSDLGVEPIMIIEYFKQKFNCGTIYKHDKLLVSKNITYKETLETLREFTEYFVLCPNCTLPEFDWKIRSKGMVVSCKSCSYTGTKTPENIGNKVASKALNSLLKKK